MKDTKPGLKLFLARDEDGSLHLHYTKPKKAKVEYTNKRHWVTPYHPCLPISSKLFPEVTFQNSPVPVESLQIQKEE